MNYSFHPFAIKELDNSINYYEDKSPGLGLEFSKEVYSTIKRILQFPNAWTKISKNCRRCMTQRFPYGIIYHVKGDELYIISIMQLNRKPTDWDRFLEG
ncbi:MAG: type II toxin-antitoxin system RelE/ParE family toxin [Candidatus Lokiarchaeota archaeon]|nr:type II toxin-antitoxin system RelE/ParE family toxin [Candidatus Lokiarchaeota archaeon]